MKQWLKAIVYTPKHTKPTDENIMRLLLPSFIGIALCMGCLAGTTWAWFTASVRTETQTITAASYDIEVFVTVKGENGSDVPVSPTQPNANRYFFNQHTEYQITLTATGTAPSGGYCKVEGGGNLHYTPRLIPGSKSFTFTLIPKETAVYIFTAVWGSYPEGTEAGDIIGKEEPPPAPGALEEQQTGADVD